MRIEAQALLRRLNALPEAARDTLFVVAVAALSVAPLLPRLPPWAAAASAALLLWRGMLAWSGRALPRRALLAALLLLGVAAVLLQYRSLFGRNPGVSLVCMLLGLKLLETRHRRDAYVVFYLGLFCVFARFLYSQSALDAAWMLLCTVGWLTALLDANLPAARPPLLRRLVVSLRLLGLGLPVMIALFVLFPRLSGPLWSLPDDAHSSSGLGSSMDPGSIASLALDSSVVFRVRFEGPRPPQAAMYWRGPVLGGFNGRDWSVLPSPPGTAPAALRPLGGKVRYTVIQQATQGHYVFPLDAPAAAPVLVGEAGTTLRLRPGLQLRASHALHQVTRFAATSWLRYAYGRSEPAARLRLLRRLPAGIDPRTVALGQSLRRRFGAGPTATQQVADAVLRMFRRQPFHYSLHPGRYRGPDAIDDFLFQRRVGFCEHFAQAFVVLMRAAGIPARIVTGYQGGSLNPIDGLWVVRQSDAHAWAEYWVRGQGWMRADPTAMVDPSRIDRSGQTLEAHQPLLGLAVLGPRDLRALRLLRDVGDALDEGWNQWVLDYGQVRQRRLLRHLGMRQPDSAQLASATALSLALLLGFGGAWLLWRRRATGDRWRTAYALLRWRLRRRGVPAHAGEAPALLAQRLRAVPGLRAGVALLMQFERARYAGDAGAARWLLLRAAFVALRGAAKQPATGGKAA